MSAPAVAIKSTESPKELEAVAKGMLNEARQRGRAYLLKLIDLGGVLDKLKAALPHGEYEQAVERIGLSLRTARRYRGYKAARTAVLNCCSCEEADEVIRTMKEQETDEVTENDDEEEAGNPNSVPNGKQAEIFCDQCKEKGPTKGCQACKALRAERKGGTVTSVNKNGQSGHTENRIKPGAVLPSPKDVVEPLGKLAAAISQEYHQLGLDRPRKPWEAPSVIEDRWLKDVKGRISHHMEAVEKLVEEVHHHLADMRKNRNGDGH